MRRIGFVISSAFIFLIFNLPSVMAQTSKLINPQVEIQYIEPAAIFPMRSEFDPIYQWLRIRRPLDEMQQFFAPLHLPGKLKIQVDKCGAERRAYVSGDRRAHV